MRIKQGILSLTILTIIFACTNNPKSGSMMTTSKASIAASDEKLGFTQVGEQFIFRLYAPSATSIDVVLFEKYDDSDGDHYAMGQKTNGVWELMLTDLHATKFYTYQSTTNKK